MGLLRIFFGIFMALMVSLSGFVAPADAASSAAIRAYDDVQPTTQNYSGQNLVRAEFSDAKLQGVDFSNADLTGAVFNGANLRGANLHGINFSDGIAYITNLAEADLTDAIFTSAMMLKSNFKDANVTGADFSFAVIDREQVSHLCKTASGTNPTTGVDTRESLGC
ncbi:pentapeptide repeat-containing protein [Leptolyngbya sp. FACHB-16]|nr:pentapeptide repeat-containing protein [Leptolyngbya sp. FACHB-16]MBD1913942.1 pentapeptide repeat-containing protein [Leptolyngbya sp. FACHB-8]MBD2153485.1 pentapeptide repeat-containing protein [Leptolyngbya sp. FACHB-16]